MKLENRMKKWVVSRIGVDHMQPKERAMRLLEEAIELAQSEGISRDQVFAQTQHVYDRPSGIPSSEAAGVAVCLLAWCAARGYELKKLALREIIRIEGKPLNQIRGSLARKADADLVVTVQSMKPLVSCTPGAQGGTK